MTTATSQRPRPSRARRRAGVVLLVLPFAGLGSVPLYARAEPRLSGVPFFYWYQLVWIALVIACMAAAAVLLGPADPADPLPDPSPHPGGRP